MDSRRITCLLATLALLLPRAGSATATGAPGSPDACAVLTRAQVSAVLGVHVEPGQHVLPDARTSCGWAAPGDPGLGAKKLVLTLMSGGAFEAGKIPVKSASKTAVRDVGDDAYYITTPPFGTALSVRKGGRYFQVRISGFPQAQAAHLEKAVALKLLKGG
jgi:hypothetical protein